MLINRVRKTKTRGVTSSYRRRWASSVPSQTPALVFDQIGSSKVLKLKTIEVPKLNPSQVLVEMKFAPVNAVDFTIINGTYPHQTPLPGVGGSEGVGKVVAVGKSVKDIKVDDVVISKNPNLGTWRNYAAVESSDVLSVPSEGVDMEYLASLASSPAVALRLLEDFQNLQEGDVIIQNGANSMVGSCIVQLAKQKGVKTLNIVRESRTDFGEQNLRLKDYGADLVVNDQYIKTSEFKAVISDLPKPKLALNLAGGEDATNIARFLGDGGTLVSYSAMNSGPVTVPSSALIFKDINIKGFWLQKWINEHSKEEVQAMYSQLIDLMKNKKLRLWQELHKFEDIAIPTALERAENTSSRARKVVFDFTK
eukprot:TRINITY_DN9788_c0_g1_i1.p1 TRINITY_DN9788_c0_g1~~TRINITY_DN9788_c0_g1_i1.p1  ORF type:complete len:366 (-),score=97.02 TRINITY_DN9788_c0_g1_i1:29-1126(-)